MGNFDRAVRAWLDAERKCPKCGAMNIPHAKPTLEPQPDGSFLCATCSYHWSEK